jgi:hypothetical protein
MVLMRLTRTRVRSNVSRRRAGSARKLANSPATFADRDAFRARTTSVSHAS